MAPDAGELDVRVRLAWRRAGEITQRDGKLAFPALRPSPAIYRLTFTGLTGLPGVYIGESADVRRRALNYRNPGPTQRTSQRLHDELMAHLAVGGTINICVAYEAEIEAGGRSEAVPMGRKTARVLAEHAALALAYLDGDVVIMNRDRGAE